MTSQCEKDDRVIINQPAAPPIIGVENLSTQYHQETVLFDINCQIRANQVFAVLGPSGSGKTTFIKSLNRTLELTPGASIKQGRVCFSGRDIHDPKVDAQSVRREIGIIHQRPVTFPMSILENVLFGARFHGTERHKGKVDVAEEFLRSAGLWDEVKDRLKASATRLSLGQQQRLCIARALANRPQVLLMDEPCSALDPIATQRIEELILNLKKSITIALITHNLSQARRVADQACFLFDGRLLEHGPTSEVFESPRNSMVRDFVSGKIG